MAYKRNGRMDRINGEVRRELSEILRDSVKDPRVDVKLVSVLRADVTRDLKYCKVYITVLGDEEARKNVAQALKSAGGFLRRELASRLNLRNTPELSFVMDDSIAYGIHIDEVLKQVGVRPLEEEVEAGIPEADGESEEEE
jgi:ribosome-binding factor A